MTTIDIGGRIRNRRKALGLTLQEVARRSGINNGNLSKIENGLQSVTNESLRKLADALECPLSEIFSEDVSERNNFGNNSVPDAAQPYRLVSDLVKLTDIRQGENVAIGTLIVDHGAARGSRYTVDEKNLTLFDGASIRQLESTPQRLAGAPIINDLMAPLLFKGDMVVVDLDERKIPDAGGVFAISLDGNTVTFRRLMPHLNGAIQLIPENKSYPTITLDAREAGMLDIVGRVKHRYGNAGF